MLQFQMRQGLRGLFQTLAVSALLAAGLAQAQSGPIKLMVGFPPGGGTDAIARILADKLKDQLGVPVLVDNKAGAGGQIAAQALKAAPADGNTLFLSHDHTITILPLVVKNPGYDSARDFVPVAGFATFANGLAVSGGTPAKTLAEYVTLVQNRARARTPWGYRHRRRCPSFWSR
jgi:tripartite-type tricarboxylate transporter receptor subunit TctC